MGANIPTADKLTNELQTAIADLRQVDPRVGLFRFVTIGAVNPQDTRGRHYLLPVSAIDPNCPPTPTADLR